MIAAGPGEGKSTVSAALLSEQPCRVHAYHLCKHGDLRRQDSVRLVRRGGGGGGEGGGRMHAYHLCKHGDLCRRGCVRGVVSGSQGFMFAVCCLVRRVGGWGHGGQHSPGAQGGGGAAG